MNVKSNSQAEIVLPDKTITCPIIEGSRNTKAIDISQLLRETGYTTYDRGYKNTAMCSSGITFIDPDNSKLYYRGYDIESLTESCDYIDIVHLLMEGDLPDSEQKTKLNYDINQHTIVHEQLHHILTGVPRSSHPMAMLLACVGALSAHYHERIDMNDKESRRLASIHLLAKLPTIAAMSYKHKMGHPINHPLNDVYYTADFLRMMFSLPSENYNPPKSYAKALDKIFILHADHELNASTSVVRAITSTGAKTYAAITGGISALWGPAHGGANEACLNMLETMAEAESVSSFISRAKDKDDPFRLMGIGHRVYKSYDPRARAIRNICHEVLKDTPDKDSTIEVAIELEKEVMNDSYFMERQLYPNIDFYSGITLKALGIPKSYFPVIFALGRLAGWLAHIEEMKSGSPEPITRPRQNYVGCKDRSVNWP